MIKLCSWQDDNIDMYYIIVGGNDEEKFVINEMTLVDIFDTRKRLDIFKAVIGFFSRKIF